MEILSPFFGIFTSLILFYYHKHFNRSNLYLAQFFLCSNFIVLVYFGLHFSKTPFWEGVFFVNFMPLSFLLGPLLFYYVKYSISEIKKFQLLDLMHLLPFIIVIIVSLPYTTLPFSKKIEIAHHIQAVTHSYDYSISCFSLKQMMFLRPLHLLIYSLISLFYFIFKTKKRRVTYGKLPENDTVLKKWIYSLIAIQLFISIYCFYDTLVAFCSFGDSFGLFTYQYYFRILGGSFFIQNTLLFLFPKILFDTISYPNDSKFKVPNFKSILLKKANPSEVNDTINIMLIDYLLGIPFIGSHFSLSKMALDLKISERVLSNYFNTELSITFSKWKNDQRIDYACSMIENGKADKITVEGISLNVGFLSRSKFIDAFKERKGVLPSAYIKQFSDF